ncbi:hypothetical protein SAICODRAFT_26969 [Saitoella complicata NRRL Y-17804]|uniref:uncharacterized protein n=1 Tax=Saitoella complicata (strain BCRC 22490 / CBS 7301 / JCM 7358 / NBRC 10748 / NRRL Y-17804) TaxID=698492 RepID=UPI000866AFF0|nr:uncharacterized protein SAICODRAFT_26969 [Saitoella complicata NRRL Y-17804]ODQ51213.1 hypothetical protein SAICODRAFT_26969 [Saitoella complicata NRRL Y-17804]
MLLHHLLLALVSTSLASAASSGWSVTNGKASLTTRANSKLSTELFDSTTTPSSSHTFDIGTGERLSLLFTCKNEGEGARPHQAYVLVRDEVTGLESAVVASVRESGKAKVDVDPRNLPAPLNGVATPLTLTLAIASKGDSKPLLYQLGKIANKNPTKPEAEANPVRYGPLPEITHTFRSEQDLPPRIISMGFAAAVIACFLALIVSWTSLDANLSLLPRRLAAAPLSSAMFIGSLIGFEALLACYWLWMRVGEVLVIGAGLGVVGFLGYVGVARGVKEF